MKKSLAIALICTSVLSFTGCSNYVAKHLGGTMYLKIEPNKKLVNATWKEDTLWYLTRPMRDDEEAETWTFEAKTEFGLFEGKVLIEEFKTK